MAKRQSEVVSINANQAKAAEDCAAGLLDINYGELSDENLVSVYGHVNTAKKHVEKARNRARSEVEERFRAVCLEEDGRLELRDAPPGYEQDEDGILKLNAGGSSLEFRPRVKVAFQEEQAREILEGYDLVEEATARSARVSNPDALLSALMRAVRALEEWDGAEAAQLREAVEKYVEVSEVLSEHRIEALVKEGKLPVEEVDGMFDATVNYALYG